MKIWIYFSYGMCCKPSHKGQNTSIRTIGKAFGGKVLSSECLLKYFVFKTEENVLLSVSQLAFTKIMFKNNSDAIFCLDYIYSCYYFVQFVYDFITGTDSLVLLKLLRTFGYFLFKSKSYLCK